MTYRDPNTLYRTNTTVGTVEYADTDSEHIALRGSILTDSLNSFRLDQIIILDIAGRFIQGTTIASDGKWSVDIYPSHIGNDNSSLTIEAFAACHSNNYIFSLDINPSALAEYKQFASSHVPENTKEIPSFADELKDLIIKSTKISYVSRSIEDAIPTGNNYQTLTLDNTLRHGGRQSRERFLCQIDFLDKNVLDIGANTGENSRIVRRLGASLVDGYEYDPYFVEIGRAANAATGMTRVSLFQGDCTRPELFAGMKYDIVLALAVWVYIKDTLKQIAEITNALIFETHTLAHGTEFYYRSVLKYFPYAVSLGYTDMPKDPNNSRMFILFAKNRSIADNLLSRKYLRVKPYFDNPFIRKYNNLSKQEVLDIAYRFYVEHSNRENYVNQDYKYASQAYYEVFLAGLYQAAENKRKTNRLVDSDNLYFNFLTKSIQYNQYDQNMKEISEHTSWMIRKVSNKYEDAFNIMDGHIDRVAPIEVQHDPTGTLQFTTVTGKPLVAKNIDGHHRFFMCELTGIQKIHFVDNRDREYFLPFKFDNSILSNYTLEVD